jgi:hypothetical protein
MHQSRILADIARRCRDIAAAMPTASLDDLRAFERELNGYLVDDSNGLDEDEDVLMVDRVLADVEDALRERGAYRLNSDRRGLVRKRAPGAYMLYR